MLKAPIDLQDVANVEKLNSRLLAMLAKAGITAEEYRAALGDSERRRRIVAAFKKPHGCQEKAPADPLLSFRRLKLPMIAARQIESAFRRDQDPEYPGLELDPLDLGLGWVKKLVPPMVIDTPNGKFEITPNWLRDYTKYCQSDAGGLYTPIPTLYIPKIKGIPFSIEAMANCWSWTHDGIQPPIQIRRLQYSNWMLGIDQKYQEIVKLALVGSQPYWKLNCWPSPAWTANLNWVDQQAVIADRKMTPNDAQHQLWFTNLAYANGIASPDSIYSRVNAMYYGDYPLNVRLCYYGVDLNRLWNPVDRYPSVRAAVSGVNWNFGT